MDFSAHSALSASCSAKLTAKLPATPNRETTIKGEPRIRVPNLAGLATRRWLEPLAISALVALAAFLRLYRLDALPPGLHYDEAYNGLDALAVLGGARPIFFEGNFGREPLFIYLVALAFRLLGAETWSIRLVSALVGVFTVVVLYFLGRELFSRPVGFLAAFALATSYWHVSVSRLGLRTVLLPLLASLVFLFLWRGLNNSTGRDFVLSGLFLGASQYTYLAARLLPLVVLLFLSFYALTRAQEFKRLVAGALLCALTSLAVFAPLGAYFLQHPTMFAGRAGQVLAQEAKPAPYETPPGTWGQNLARTAGMFSFRGDENPRQNLPGRPVFDPASATLFYLGLAVALFRFRQPEYFLLLAWLAVMLLPTGLSEFAPHYLRATGALPAAAIFPALLLLDRERPVIPTAWRKTAWGLVTLVLVGSGCLAFRDYFSVWAKGSYLFHSFDAGLVEVGRYLGTQRDSRHLYVSPAYGAHPTVLFASRSRQAYASFDGRQVTVLPPASARATYVVFVGQDPDTLPRLRDALGEGQIVNDFLDPQGQVYARAYALEQVQVRRPPTFIAPANLGNQIELVGFDLRVPGPAKGPAWADGPGGRPRIFLSAGQALELLLYWRSLAATDNAYTAFVHLLGSLVNPASGNALWGQQDKQPGGGSYPTAAWKPGELILDRFAAPCRPALPLVNT